MCHPMDSTSWNDWGEIKEFYKKENNIMFNIVEEHNLERKPFLDKFQDNPLWWESLERNLPYFRRVEFAGGEPLMDPQHYRILDMLKPYGHQIEIKYATNATTLGIKNGRTIHDYWPHFKSIAVNVSLDGVNSVYEYIRGNADFNEVDENIQIIREFPNISRLVFAMTVQMGNVLHMRDVMLYAFKNEAIFHTHRVEYPKLLSAQVLPNDLQRLAVQKLELMKDIARDCYPSLIKDIKLLEYTLNQIQYNINYLNARDQSHLWRDSIEFNTRLDKTRNQSLFQVNPEFKLYV